MSRQTERERWPLWIHAVHGFSDPRVGFWWMDFFPPHPAMHSLSSKQHLTTHISPKKKQKKNEKKKKQLHPANLTPLRFHLRSPLRSRRPCSQQSPAWRPRSHHSGCSASSSWAQRLAAEPPSADAHWRPGGRRRTDATQPMARWGRTRRRFWRPGAAAPLPWRPREGVRR